MKQVSVGEALRRKYPEWIVFVVTHDPDGPDDLMPAGWCMICSGSPPMIGVGIGHGRHTHTLIEKTGEFNVAWAGAGQEELIAYAGSHTGAEVDKFAAMNLATTPGSATRVPLVEGCATTLECRLAGRLATGDHTVFAGEVLAAHVADPPVANLVNFSGQYAAARPT